MEFIKKYWKILLGIIVYTIIIVFATITIYKAHIKNELETLFDKELENFFSIDNTESEDKNNKESDKNSSENKSQEVLPLSIGEKIVTENIEITITNAKIAKTFDYQQEDIWDGSYDTYSREADEDKKYVLLEGTVKNISSSFKNISKLIDCDILGNGKYEYITISAENPRGSGDIYCDALETVNIQIYGDVFDEAITESCECTLTIDNLKYIYKFEI